MIALDRASLLADVPGSSVLEDVERELQSQGLTLGVRIASAKQTVAQWLGDGAPGAPSSFADPADHLLAGLTATLSDGRSLVVHPGPRRAVGPDLTALFVGTKGRFGTIDRVWLRVHLRDAARPAMTLPSIDHDPPLSSGEEALLGAIEREIGATS